MTKTNWEIANHYESEHWEKFSAEIDTLIHTQPQFLDALMINADYFENVGMTLNFSGLKVLDVGGGPVSILLRSNKGYSEFHDGFDEGVVIDPVKITDHQRMRYEYFDIKFIQDKAENITNYYKEKYFDECFIYNCLQHVEDPIKILDGVTQVSKKIRIAEPIYVPTDKCHLHTFTEHYFANYFDKDGWEIEMQNIVNIGSPHYVGIIKLGN